MFKRVERRLKRKEEEEELGIDEDMKEVMGLQDTDSSESDSSDSDSDSDSDASDGGEDHTKKISQKRKLRDGADSDGDEDEDGSDEEAGSEGEEGVSDEEEDDLVALGDEEDDGGSSDEEPLMTVSQALKDPLYVISLDPDVRACVSCPGKMLKNPKMIEVHMSSNAHKRRFKKLRELAMTADPEADVGDILGGLEKEESEPAKQEPASGSKRAQKRQAKQAALKAKRLKQKEAKAKAAARKKAKEETDGVLEGKNATPSDAKPAEERGPIPTGDGKPPAKVVKDKAAFPSKAKSHQRNPRPLVTSDRTSTPKKRPEGKLKTGETKDTTKKRKKSDGTALKVFH